MSLFFNPLSEVLAQISSPCLLKYHISLSPTPVCIKAIYIIKTVKVDTCSTKRESGGKPTCDQLAWKIYTSPAQSVYVLYTAHSLTKNNMENTTYMQSVFGHLITQSMPCSESQSMWEYLHVNHG